jgi:hypothetical protein
MTDCDTSKHPFHPFFETFKAPFGETLKLRSKHTETRISAGMVDGRRELRIGYKTLPRLKLAFHATNVAGRPSAISVMYQGQTLGAPDWAALAERCKLVTGFPVDVLALIRQVAGEEAFKGHFELYGM